LIIPPVGHEAKICGIIIRPSSDLSRWHGTGDVFSAPNANAGIVDRHRFDNWLSVAEKKAKLSKLDGSLWHEYRRKWAIERKHRPLRDVAAAGGWKEVDTLLEVYQQADEASVLAGTPTGGMPGIP
jgi:hypothetical protein